MKKAVRGSEQMIEKEDKMVGRRASEREREKKKRRRGNPL